jgi:hypothetical protein
MVVDDQSLSEGRGPFGARREREDVARYLEREHDQRLSQYTVLLVKIGDEAHLYSPISFLPLFEAGLALDVRRHDYYGASEDPQDSSLGGARFACPMIFKRPYADATSTGSYLPRVSKASMLGFTRQCFVWCWSLPSLGSDQVTIGYCSRISRLLFSLFIA